MHPRIDMRPNVFADGLVGVVDVTGVHVHVLSSGVHARDGPRRQASTALPVEMGNTACANYSQAHAIERMARAQLRTRQAEGSSDFRATAPLQQ